MATARAARQLAREDPVFRRLQRGDPMADPLRWLRALDAARAEGWHLDAALLGLDGLALVSSRSVEDGDHEVRVSGGRVISCSCNAGRAHSPCCHAGAVALQLWEREMACDLSRVPSRALVGTVLSRYVGRATQRGRSWGSMLAPDGQPERAYAGPVRSDPEFC